VPDSIKLAPLHMFHFHTSCSKDRITWPFIQRSEPSTLSKTHFERGDQYVLRLPESLSPREMPTSACCNWLSVDRMPYCSSPSSRTCNCCVIVGNDPSLGHCWTRTLREASGTSIEALEAARCFCCQSCGLCLALLAYMVME
jgi:hypothetical protein